MKRRSQLLVAGSSRSLSALSRSGSRSFLSQSSEATWPLDYIGSEMASWGMYALRRTMAGQPAMDIRRGSDLTDLTVNFRSSDGKFDTAAAAAFYGAGTKGVKTWYDQSGNGNHLTQATDNNKPGYELLSNFAVPMVNFDAGAANYLVGLANATDKGFTLSPGIRLQADATGYTLYQMMLVRDRTSTTMSGPPEFGNVFIYGINAANGIFSGVNPSTTAPPKTRIFRWNSFVDVQARGANLRPSVIVHRINAAGNTITSDLVHRFDGTVTGPFDATMVSLGLIGSLKTVAVSLLALVLFRGTHTDQQVAAMQSLFQQRFGYQQPTYQLFFAGDSITSGFNNGGTNFDERADSWPFQLVSTMGLTTARAVNVAVASRTANTDDDWDDQMVDAEYSASYTKHILVVAVGSNDIAVDGDSAATAYSDIKNYCDHRRAAGWNKILVCTIVPRQGLTGGQEAIRTSLNTLLKANADNAWEAVADVAAQNWQPGGAADWSTNYADGVHPNAAGRTLFCNAVQPVLATLI